MWNNTLVPVTNRLKKKIPLTAHKWGFFHMKKILMPLKKLTEPKKLINGKKNPINRIPEMRYIGSMYKKFFIKNYPIYRKILYRLTKTYDFF